MSQYLGKWFMGNKIARAVKKQSSSLSNSFSVPANPSLNQEWINPKDWKKYRWSWTRAS